MNIAAKADKNKKLIDACCGVGTIILEACLEGYNIEGSDINWKICRDARENIAYFNYQANVFRSDIKGMSKHYDAAIIDIVAQIITAITFLDAFCGFDQSGSFCLFLILLKPNNLDSIKSL